MTKFIKKIVLTVTFFLAIGLFTKTYAATFEFSPSNANLTQGCNYQATIMIDTQGQASNAADIIVNYNTSEIEIIDSNPSLPGKQIGTGNAYEIYVGNEVDEGLGRIRLTGSSLIQNLNGERVFANINFRSIGATASTTFNIVYNGIGATLDSNIAEANTSLDLLNGVTNATYNFAPGDCFTDTTPPTIQYIYPTNGSQNIPLDANVEIRISDSQSGVDISTVVVTINGRNYTYNDPEFSYSGSPSQYTIIINPSENFTENGGSTIRVTARDQKGNERQSFISFNIPPNVVVVPTGVPAEPAECPVDTEEPPVVIDTGDKEPIIIEKIVEKQLECQYTPEELKDKIDKQSTGIVNVVSKTSSDVLLNSYTPAVITGLVLSSYAGLMLASNGTGLSIFATIFSEKKIIREFGVILNSRNNKPVSFAKVEVKYSDGKMTLLKADKNGKFFLKPGAEEYQIKASKDGFKEIEMKVDSKVNPRPIIEMDPVSISLKGIWEKTVIIFSEFSPYLAGVGLTISILQGILTSGNVLTPYTIVYSIIIGLRVLRSVI